MSDLIRLLTYGSPWLALLAVVHAVIVAIAAGHAILYKRDVRAAVGWSGLIALSPFVGPVAYYLFGINRIRRRASQLAVTRPAGAAPALTVPSRGQLAVRFNGAIERLARSTAALTGSPLLRGNAVDPLQDGDAAYPAMLQAIDKAQRSIFLQTYIFDSDRAGTAFIDALARAVKRGVEVRVLIDGVGKRYSVKSSPRLLRARGVTTAEFLPTRLPLPKPYMNLRNHRKLLVVDRAVAFTGGLNIREGHQLSLNPVSPIQDVHFRLRGPIVDRSFEIGAEDWAFATGERLDGAAWQSGTAPAGSILARGIPDGPDDDADTARWTMLAALGAARSQVRICSPYFLPDRTLLTALSLAALRGVEVDILIPERNNLLFVQWAMVAQLWQVIEPGCRVWLTPPPFDHSKLFVVDGMWSFIGSANWDERSLRLNFEYNVECYDRPLAQQLVELTDAKLAVSSPVTAARLDARSLPIRLRDGFARLLAPYL